MLVTQLDLPCLRNVVRLMMSFNEINGLKERLAACRDGAERERLRQSVNDLTLKYNLLVEHYRGKRRSD